MKKLTRGQARKTQTHQPTQKDTSEGGNPKTPSEATQSASFVTEPVAGSRGNKLIQ